ncbi:MAG: hypothetical protein ACFE8L_09990 [Candidatus Hodarchaeota archaeon]
MDITELIDQDELNEPKSSSSEPNGKPLLIHQYANISSSESYSNVRSGENISFTLVEEWTSKNVSINYEGVSIEKNYAVNGDFADNESGWFYEEVDINGVFSGRYTDIQGSPPGAYRIKLDPGDYITGDRSYIYQNYTFGEKLASGIARVSFDFITKSGSSYPANASIYIAIIINGVEKNYTIDMDSISFNILTSITMQYDPISFGQVLPGESILKIGIIIEDDCTKASPDTQCIFDNINFKLWTQPNKTGILKATDVEFSQDYTYYNTTYGNGYSFIEVDRTRSPTDIVIFTINENITEIISDFLIKQITITSYGVKIFNSTFSAQLGSLYTVGENISWEVEFNIDIPSYYNSWVIVDKPIDWLISHVLDNYNIDQTGNCQGTGLGSVKLLIPNSIIYDGDWKLEAISMNYISDGNSQVWNGSSFLKTTTFTFNDNFQIIITLNDSISLPNTQINLTLFYPNSSIFWRDSREPTSYNEKYGNFTVGTNMTVGKYLACLEWVNNLSSDQIFKVGYIEIEFNIWHHTTLTAVDSYLEKSSGDPCLIKIIYTDYDFDTFIGFATVTYNSTFGQSGDMIYIGSGVYILDLDTSKLGLGDHYFSFNASKSYYQNQTSIDLIHLKIIGQPNYINWYIIFGLLLGISILGFLSLRTYVILPLKRKKESNLLAKTQKYKDSMNIEALVISHRDSGLLLYTKSYFILKEHQDQLLSNFILAITVVSNEIIGKEKIEKIMTKPEYPKDFEKIIELDFKHFNFFICNYKKIRLILILKKKASERFKDQTASLLMDIDLKFSDQLENWNGKLNKFEKTMPALLDQHYHLYYKEPFKLNKNNDVKRIMKEGNLSKMKLRLLNAIISMTKDQEEFYLIDAIGTVHEKNQDKIIEALEMLIESQVIISSKKRSIK